MNSLLNLLALLKAVAGEAVLESHWIYNFSKVYDEIGTNCNTITPRSKGVL